MINGTPQAYEYRRRALDCLLVWKAGVFSKVFLRLDRHESRHRREDLLSGGGLRQSVVAQLLSVGFPRLIHSSRTRVTGSNTLWFPRWR